MKTVATAPGSVMRGARLMESLPFLRFEKLTRIEHNSTIMTHLKGRFLGIVIILVFATLMYVNWQQLTTTGTYSIKMATMVPVGLVGGLFLLLFPAKAGKPTTTKDKVLVLVVFAVGILAGLVNWYLMDPGFFGQ